MVKLICRRWSNRSDEWIRIFCVVLDAQAHPAPSGDANLSEAWLQ
jgi:hypothetical protein